MIDVKRAIELALCSSMSPLVPGHSFFPFQGFGLNQTNLEPPFTVVTIHSAEKTIHDEQTYFCEGAIQVVTHAGEVESEGHSSLARSILNAIACLGQQVRENVIIHGMDVSEQRSADDQDHAAHVDTITFTAGATML